MAPWDENKKKRLIHLMVRGKLDEVIGSYEKYPECRWLQIPKTGDTALHVAVSDEWDIYVQRMVNVAGAESGVLELRNEQGDTALHVAAKFGNTYICKCIAEKDVALIGAQNEFGETPLFSAVSRGKTKAFLYLYQLSKDKAPESLDLKQSYTRSNGDTILHTAITEEFFDLAYIIIDKYQGLVHQKNRDGLSPLHLLATKPSVFQSGVQAFGIRKLIYHCVRVRKLSKRDLAKAPNPTIRWAAILREAKGFSYRGLVAEVLEDVIGIWSSWWKSRFNREVIGIWSSWWKSKFNREEQRDGEAANKQVDQNNQQDEETTNNQGYGEIDEEDAEAANEQVVHKENLRQDETATDKEDSAKVDTREVILWALLVLLTLPIYVVFFLCFSCPYKLLKITFMLAKTIFGYEEYARLKHIKETCVWSEEVMNKLIKSEHAYKQSRLQPKPPREATIESVENPIYAAAKNGISEMVLRILDDYPEAVYEKNVDQKNILMLAVEYRRHRLYDELISKERINRTILEQVDKDGNNLLHIAANLQAGKKFWSIRGAALHMHMEIKWYEFIKKSMPPRFFARHNNDKQTPKEIFKESHKDLIKEGRQWLTNTSQSCSLVAALIATVAFATSATIPGGHKQDNGVPSLEHKKIFIVSASASLVALSSSMISVVMFLAILTSSFQLKDFRKDLPYKLLLGLISLLVSIVSMIISFFAGHHFVLRQEFNHDAALAYELMCSFLVVYIILKFPLDFEIVWSTLRTNPPK